MIYTRVGSLGWLFVLCCFLTSCQNGSDRSRVGKQIRLNIHSEPPSLDPRKATDTTSISVIKMCFEGLTRLEKEGQSALAIAESYDVSEDALVYLFSLKDTKWSDGHSVTAYDFEKTWKTILGPTFVSTHAYELYVIKNGKKAKEGLVSIDEVGVKALSDSLLQVTLEHPVPYFLDLLATPIFFPSPTHIVDTIPYWAANAGPHFVSNGPFTLKTWRHHNEIVVEKSSTYWHSNTVQLDKIHLSMIGDETTALSLFYNDELDWAGGPMGALPTDALPTLEKQGLLHRYLLSGVYYFVINVTKPPYNNVHIRKALALAIDRESIIQNIVQGGQIPATGFIPPTMWKDQPTYFKDGDVAEAKREFHLGLKELGMKLSDFPPITLSYNTLEAHHKIAQAIQDQWLNAFGIKVHLENKEWKVYLDELSSHQFEVARLGGIASVNDPVNFLDSYRDTLRSDNYGGWENQGFTSLIDQASLTIDTEERTKLLKQAEKIFIDEMPIIPLYFYTSTYLKKPYVHNVLLTKLGGMDFTSAYLSTEGDVQ